MECVEVCKDDALQLVPQTTKTVETLRNNWDFWVNGKSSRDISPSDLVDHLGPTNGERLIDQAWLRRVSQLLAKLRKLHFRYTKGTTGTGRKSLGIINATGCTSVWGSTYPFNPYPFPWTNHLFQDSLSVAMGIFEGHMAKMAEGFKAIQEAELELEGKYSEAEHGRFFTYFDWRQASRRSVSVRRSTSSEWRTGRPTSSRAPSPTRTT